MSQDYKVYWQRWPLLGAYCAFSFTNAMGFVQYSPITPQAAEYYDISQGDVTWFSNAYYLTYFVLGALAIRPLQWRLDVCLIGACILSMIGSWMIYGGRDSFGIAMGGFILVGVAQVFQLSSPAYISDKWFPPEERTFATSIGSFINFLGLNFSFNFAAFYAQDATEPTDITNLIENMNLIFAIMASVACLLIVIFVRDSPPTPPSYSADHSKDSVIKSFIKIFTKLEYLCDIVSIAIFIGIGWEYIVVIGILLSPYNYSQSQIGIAGLVYNISGVAGGLLASFYLDQQIKQNKRPNYDFFTKFFMSLGFFSLILEAIVIPYAPYGIILFLSAVVGLGLNAYFPIAIQGYVDKLYPSFELALTTMLLIMANLCGFIVNYILVVPEWADSGLWICCIILAPFYLYMLFVYKTKFVRHETEANAKLEYNKVNPTDEQQKNQQERDITPAATPITQP